MGKKCFYDVFLNDKRIATVGPGTLKQLHVSFGITFAGSGHSGRAVLS